MQPYKTNKDLIDNLINSKNIVFNNIYSNIFDERSYCTLVNPYKKLVCIGYDANNKKYIYKKNTKFSKFIKFEYCDEYISKILSIYIGIFEQKLKEYIGKKLSEKFYRTNVYCNDYSEINNIINSISNRNAITETNKHLYNTNIYDLIDFNKMYDNNSVLTIAEVNIIRVRYDIYKKIINSINHADNSQNLLIKHYHDQNNKAPIWLIVHTLSFGDLMFIFNMFKKEDKEEFCKEVLNKEVVYMRDIVNVSAKLNTIRKLRNNINHYEPLLPVIIDSIDNNKIDEIISCIDMLANNARKSKINSIKYNKPFFLLKIEENDFNRKYIKNIVRVLNKIK